MAKLSRFLMAGAVLAAQAGIPHAPLFNPRKVREPRMILEPEEVEKLASFDDSKEGRKAKKAYVRELEAKYKGAGKASA